MTEAGILLRASHLAFSYGAEPVFSGIDLAIAQREIVCLIGASGCGKSTLLRLLAGLATPDAGQVIWRGEPAPHGAPAHRPRTLPGVRTGTVFQSPALLPWLNVAENVGFGLDFGGRYRESRAERARRIGQALRMVGLADHARKRPAALSGGMAQRVALARALARDPDIIYLDEPFSALDAITRESMQDMIVDLAHQQQSAVFLVTHDIDEALRIGDRVLLLTRSQSSAPARIGGEWHPDGTAPRQHRSRHLNSLREDILNALSHHPAIWHPQI